MNSKSLRRLAADHGSLRTAGLPPNYLFPPGDPSDDLTRLDILLAGPVGTPYAGGVWKLRLDIPPTYPSAPPTARFITHLWHPNIDEQSGAVCVETLKRDWSSSLKLRDVLVTISCLLIQPNPASALNEDAGKLANEDWDAYCRRAQIMTDIHAPIPRSLAAEVREAQNRGEEKEAMEGDSKMNVKGMGKGKGKVTPAASKVHGDLVDEEENLRRRGTTVEPESDPESDWIPGPIRPPKAPAGQNNIFGIKGLDDGLHFDSSPKRVFSPNGKPTVSDEQDDDNNNTSDPFITVPGKRPVHQPFTLPAPPSDSVKTPAKDTPELLKFSHQNPFSTIQPNNQVHPLLKEFSWSWEDAAMIHDDFSAPADDVVEDAAEDAAPKLSGRKRLASEEFKQRQAWEMKRFKRTGFNLKKYNRGDFGPKRGIARL